MEKTEIIELHAKNLKQYVGLALSEDECRKLIRDAIEEALNIADVGGNEVALKLKEFAEKQQDIPDDIQAIINDNFWDLL